VKCKHIYITSTTTLTTTLIVQRNPRHRRNISTSQQFFMRMYSVHWKMKSHGNYQMEKVSLFLTAQAGKLPQHSHQASTKKKKKKKKKKEWQKHRCIKLTRLMSWCRGRVCSKFLSVLVANSLLAVFVILDVWLHRSLLFYHWPLPFSPPVDFKYTPRLLALSGSHLYYLLYYILD